MLALPNPPDSFPLKITPYTRSTTALNPRRATANSHALCKFIQQS